MTGTNDVTACVDIREGEEGQRWIMRAHPDDRLLAEVAVTDTFVPKQILQEWAQLKNKTRTRAVHSAGL